MKPKQHYVHSTKGNRQRIHIYGWKRTSEIFRWYAAFTNQQWEVVLDNQHKHLHSVTVTPTLILKTNK